MVKDAESNGGSMNNKQVTVYRPSIRYHEWRVECITNDDDGSMDMAIFYGPSAEAQAKRWCNVEYPGISVSYFDINNSKTAVAS